MHNNPVLQKAQNFILYILFWLMVILVYAALLHFTQNIDQETSIVDACIFNFLLAGFGLGLWYSARFISLDSSKFFKIITRHLTAGILFTILWLSAGYFLINTFFSLGEVYKIFFYDTLIWRFLIGILFYFLLTSFYYVIIYYSGFQERAIKETELKNLVTEAELKSLKFQINPHFIFNSLNSMSALTSINPLKAREMILKLADFLRYTLANNEKQKNPLREELKNIKLYLDIEKIRFEDKFDFIENVHDECLDTQVPNMILQPLFENAIKHAVYETLDKVEIKLCCNSEQEFLKITLENNFDQNSGAKPGAGVGLQNIKNRLKLIYNMDNLFHVNTDDNIFKVILFIPDNKK